MNVRRTLALVIPVAASLLIVAAPAHAVDFDRQIAPLLADRCLQCHHGAEAKGKLTLSDREKAFAGGESGAAIVPGKPNDSLLWQHVRDDEMPPKKPLAAEEKALLKTWIAEGAKWGSLDTLDPLAYTTASRAGYDWWSLQPIAKVTPPVVKDGTWGRNAIDAFVLAKLEAAGLHPQGEADRRTLIRRLSFDLLGLPPAPEAVEAFIADKAPNAYEKLVDQLLESPQYGERWGRHWLDIVRYGESDGFERNAPRQNSWPYRDWVIRALNNDMPYDEFVRMQFIGEKLVAGPDGTAAQGFLVAGVHNTTVGGSERMQKLARQDELEEITATVSQTFLGLTVHCARCHDHKFDPIPQTEYYSMISALDDVRHGEKKVIPPESGAEITKLNDEIKKARDAIDAIDAPAKQAVLETRKGGKPVVAGGPQPMSRWDFDEDLRDSIGGLDGQAEGTAALKEGALVLDGDSAFVRTAEIKKAIEAKTLEAWVVLDNLDQSGGAAIAIETGDGGEFDAIVFGEREEKKWMAGSNGFVRYQSFRGPAETEATKAEVHMAIVYDADGSVQAYRNGKPYGAPYKSTLKRYEAGSAHVVFGIRHLPAGSNKMLKGRVVRAQLYDRALTPQEVAASAGIANDFVREDQLIAALEPAVREQRETLKKQIAELQAKIGKVNQVSAASVYTNVGGAPSVMRIHLRGDIDKLGDEVAPSGVHAINAISADFGLAKNASGIDRRTKLAEWITNPDNPLPVRVMANRLWHYHFGTGIVDTPSDFGFNGGRPSHPELLDYLASELRSSGYRLKQMHRLIVNSSTYRQATAPDAKATQVDAGNRLLWRFSPQRLQGEEVRDSILLVAGTLNLAGGGPGYVDVAINNNNGTTYYEPIDPDKPEFQRRTIYRFVPRGGRPTLLDTFDCPDPSTTAPRRAVTTTPLQALSLLNSPLVLRVSDDFAERVRKEAGADVPAQIERMWQLAFQRKPDAEEAHLAAELVAKHGLPTLARGLYNTNEFLFARNAARPKADDCVPIARNTKFPHDEDHAMKPETKPAACTRRELLHFGAQGLAATALVGLLGRDGIVNGAEHTSEFPNFAPKAKRAIHISLVGGMSHLDSFDYKPELEKLHGKTLETKEKPDIFFGQVGLIRKNDWEFRQRGKSGLWISEMFPNIAGMADELSLIRSMVSDSANHTPALFFANSGFQFNGFPSLGSWLSYGLGSECEELPSYVVLPDGRGGPNGGASNWTSGFLPAQHQGVVFGSGDEPVRDLQPARKTEPQSETDLRDFLARMNQKNLDQAGADDLLSARMRSYQLAAKMQLSVPSVSDISGETAATLAMYGVDDKATKECGQRCLLARRLLEKGVRFVEVYSGGPIGGNPRSSWDAHENVKENHTAEAMRIDKPVAGLLADLKARGMLEDTLVIFTTEFGRTPFTQAGAGAIGTGRDHNRLGFAVWLAGAGVKRGHSYGTTDDTGWKAVENPTSWHDFHATVLHLFGVDHEKLTYYHNGIRRRLTNVHGVVAKGVLA